MPGKTPNYGRPRPTRRESFNEAPAKCRGKPSWEARSPQGTGASMRPQRNAGENQLASTGTPSIFRLASMRPQRNAGENVPVDVAQGRPPDASMRPQRNAGENRSGAARECGTGRCFNEAPAKCRGKHWYRAGSCATASQASMRPQRNAGENQPNPQGNPMAQPASMRPQRNAGENLCSRCPTRKFRSTLQ